MADVASLAVALHLNAASFKAQLTDAYSTAANESRKFTRQVETGSMQVLAPLTNGHTSKAF
ncbi:hypothetical protein [Arsenophonus nasoniae]|uniref:Uncharacterized protein n=1 Tax=Arsenophonus nasoniae TaxID=638 RepID=A0A4P7KVC7_9GAMM|nr:hypothetical protein [Arsenophonus nasoniae]QBY44199.1 hypothetical protein ArsFIN_27760 [Arsenophonus nasoniae]